MVRKPVAVSGGYYLERHRPLQPPQVFYIRPYIVSKYRGFLNDSREALNLEEQIFEVMQFAKNEDEYITRGEFIAILRRMLSAEKPDKYELERFRKLVYLFRKWFGVASTMVVYVRRQPLDEKHFKGIEWIYRPLKNKEEYKEIRKHIDRVSEGLRTRQEENLKLLRMTQAQIDKHIMEVARKLDLKKRRRNQKYQGII